MKTTATAILIAGMMLGASAASAAEVTAPRDISTGQASGKRMHKPFVITKTWSSRAAASADCAKVDGALSGADGKLACTVQLDGMPDDKSACAKLTAGLPGARCEGKTMAADDWQR
ncbi:MAG: hypothetical protein P4L64_14310 [Caulobacteraceae bacterium]|nr:hypothetical protein [Caulobacteraceae bacterium]